MQRSPRRLGLKEVVVTVRAPPQPLEEHGPLDRGAFLQPITDPVEGVLLGARALPEGRCGCRQPAVQARSGQVSSVGFEPSGEQAKGKGLGVLRSQRRHHNRPALAELVQELCRVLV